MQVPLQQVTTLNAVAAAEPWPARNFLFGLQLACLRYDCAQPYLIFAMLLLLQMSSHHFLPAVPSASLQCTASPDSYI